MLPPIKQMLIPEHRRKNMHARSKSNPSQRGNTISVFEQRYRDLDVARPLNHLKEYMKRGSFGKNIQKGFIEVMLLCAVTGKIDVEERGSTPE